MDTKIKEDLAYAYRIIAKLGMDDHTYTHLSARPKGADYYYIYPFGYRFDEVTPSSLLKVSLNGEIIEGKEKQYNKTGYVIHGTIYRNRDELNSIFHLHTIATVAVSAMKKGLLPISQWALHFYEGVSYHTYNALALDDSKHGDPMVLDLADKKVMFLRNHGFITCGETIQEALFYCYHLELACKTQMAALSCNSELIIPSHDICKQTCQDVLSFEKNLGERDWEAWVRCLSF
ncbi:Class II aldolase/adducin domain protein [Candidatus Megaera venefica]|uniref:Class II aldolase/adducin domain protein n=1 Tax=Candidatus Megaera venefica TaxID=2055910 RepID=A0ABU5NDM3_9RICK|nr:class II aldolase/adducin family protein [Candidatus Megaera venefica]MEA0971257.1 Class II aldolase/adducin domain protein [Candidatus Megaera venefica]